MAAILGPKASQAGRRMLLLLVDQLQNSGPQELMVETERLAAPRMRTGVLVSEWLSLIPLRTRNWRKR